MSKRLLEKGITVVLMWACFGVGHAQVREIPLAFLSKEEVHALVSPHLSAGDSVSYLNGMLYLDSNRSVFNRISALLKKADKAPESFRVQIRRGGSKVSSGRRHTNKQKTVAGQSGRFEKKVLSGQLTFVETGVGISELGYESASRRHGSSIQAQLGQEGFFLLTRVADGKVSVRASELMVSDRYNRAEGIDESHLVFANSGDMGQWISLTPEREEASRRVVRSGDTGRSTTRFQIRVQPVN